MEDCVQVEVHTLEKHLSTLNKKIIENNKYGKSKEEIHKEHEKYEGEAKGHGIG